MLTKLGTQSSLSGYPLKFWWMKFSCLFKRRQKLGLLQQYFSGVRYFDLRFAKYRGVWYGADGLHLYKVTLDSAISTLIGVASVSDPVFFRLVCEDTFYSCSVDDLSDSVQSLMSDKGSKALVLTCVVRYAKKLK